MKKRTFSRPVSVILEPKIFEIIEKITNEREISISDYIREAIREKLQNDNTDNK